MGCSEHNRDDDEDWLQKSAEPKETYIWHHTRTLLTWPWAFFKASFFFSSNSAMTAAIFALSFKTIFRFLTKSLYWKCSTEHVNQLKWMKLSLRLLQRVPPNIWSRNFGQFHSLKILGNYNSMPPIYTQENYLGHWLETWPFARFCQPTCSSAFVNMFIARMFTFLLSLSLVSDSLWIRFPASFGSVALKS